MDQSSTTLSFATAGLRLPEVVERVNAELTELQAHGATIGEVRYTVGVNEIRAVYLGAFTFTRPAAERRDP